MALVGIWAVEERLPYSFLLLQKFFERFPDSVFPPRAVMAGLMMRLSHEKTDYEAAATAARMHLAATFIGSEYEKYVTAWCDLGLLLTYCCVGIVHQTQKQCR